MKYYNNFRGNEEYFLIFFNNSIQFFTLGHYAEAGFSIERSGKFLLTGRVKAAVYTAMEA